MLTRGLAAQGAHSFAHDLFVASDYVTLKSSLLLFAAKKKIPLHAECSTLPNWPPLYPGAAKLAITSLCCLSSGLFLYIGLHVLALSKEALVLNID